MTTEEERAQNPQEPSTTPPTEATPPDTPAVAEAAADQAPPQSVSELHQKAEAPTQAERVALQATTEEAAAIAPEPAEVSTPAPAEVSTPAEVPVAETVESSAVESSAVEAVKEAEPTAEADPAPPVADSAGEAAAPAVEKTSDRIRQKLGAGGGDKPVGSVDIQTQRPEIPTNTKPVDIPGADDLDENIAAEIAAALTGDVAMPGMSVPVPPEEASAVGEDGVAAGPVELEEVGPGSRVKGIIQQIHGDDVFVNAGLLHDVVISLKQFAEKKKQPEVGDTVSAVVETIDADGLFRSRLPEAKTKAGGNWDGLAVDQVVDCTVTAVNKGGLQVLVSNLKGFLPASQVDLGYVSDLEKYVGQTMTVKITEVKPKKRNLVVSRRAILQEERESAQEGFWETLEVGQDMTGTVKTIKNYGAFVNLGAIDGFLHVGEISWSRINHPNEVLKEGQEVQVRILKIDKEKTRISLGMKQLVQNPWQGLSDRYPTERIVSGTVTRTSDFGAFVELEPGVEGLVHISQLAWRRVNTVSEVLKVGEEKEFQVLEVDQKRKRVSLSLKALEKRPESAKPAEDDAPPRPPRKPNPNLRGGAGGTGSGGGGGLFGNPSDFK